MSIANDILPLMPESERREIIALQRTDPGAFRKRIQHYKTTHPAEVRQIIAIIMRAANLWESHDLYWKS